MKRILLVSAMILLVVVVALSLLTSNARREGPYTITTGKTSVVKELREMKRLETAQFTIEKVIDAGTSGSTFREILFGDRILLIAHGNVIAGFDLSQIAADDVIIEEDSVKLSMPAPKILITTLDNEQTRVYDRRQGIFTKGDKDLESVARKAAEANIRQAACDAGILKTARDNGKKQLTLLLKSLQFTTVEVTIPEGKC